MGDLRQELELVVEQVESGEMLDGDTQRWVAGIAQSLMAQNERLFEKANEALVKCGEAIAVAIWLIQRGERPTRRELDEYPWNVPFVREWLKRKGCDTVAQTED